MCLALRALHQPVQKGCALMADTTALFGCTCSLCRGLGWVVEGDGEAYAHHQGKGLSLPAPSQRHCCLFPSACCCFFPHSYFKSLFPV